MPTSRSSGRLTVADESKWEGESRLGSKDDVKQQLSDTKQRVQDKLQKAKKDINDAAAELEAELQEDEREPLSAGEEPEEDEEELGAAAGGAGPTLRSRGSAVKKQVEGKTRELKSKGRNLAASIKQQGREILAQGKAALRQTQAAGGQDAGEEEGGEGRGADWQATLASKGSSLLNQGLERAGALRSKLEAAAPGVKDSLGRVANKAKSLLAQAPDFQDGEQEAESDSADEEEAGEGEEGEEESGVSRQAANLKSRASDVADSGRKAARKGKAALDDTAEEAVDSGRQAVRRGKAALDDAADNAAEGGRAALRQGKSALSDAAESGRRVLRQGKAVLDEATADLPDTLNSWRAQGAKKLEQARVQGEKLVGKARDTAANFDLDAAREQAVERASELGKSLRNKGASLRQQAEEAYDENVPADTKARLRNVASTASSKLRGVQSQARDALSDAEEDLGVSDDAFNAAAAKGLRKFDRVVAKDGNMTLPMMVVGAIAVVWLAASLYQLVNGPVEVAPPPPTTVLDAARQAAHDWKQAGIEQLHHIESRTQGFVDTLTGHKRPLTWGEKISNSLSSFKDTLFGALKPGFDVAHARDALRNARDRAEERSAGLQHTLEDQVIPTLKDGYHNLADNLASAKRYTKDKLIPGAKDGYDRASEVAQQAADEARYHAQHSDEYVAKAREAGANVANLARSGAEDLNLIPKQSLGSRVWAWMTGRETVVEQAQRLAHEAQLKVDAMRAPRSVGERLADGIKAHLPGHHATIGERVQNGANDLLNQAGDLKDRFFRNIPNLDKSGTAAEYVERAKAAGYTFRDGAWALLPHHRTVGERVVDSIKSHLPGAHPSATQQVQDGIANLKDQASQLSDRISRNIPNLDTHGSIEEYAARAKAAGYELRDGAWTVINNVLPHERSLGERIVDSIKSHLPGAHPSVQQRVQNGIEAFQRNIPNIDAHGSVREYADRAKAAGYELRDGVWAMLPHQRTIGERIVDGVKSHIPGAHPSATQQVQDGLQSLRDQAAALGDRLQRNLPNIDARGTAQEYADRAWAAGYELRDGVWDFLPHHRSLSERLVDGVKSRLPGAHPSATQQVQDGLQSLREQAAALGNRLQRNLPNIDPRGSAEEYADRAWAAGYRLRDGAWDLVDRAREGAQDATSHLPHRRSVAELAADSIRAHLPGATPSYQRQAQDGLQALRDQASALGNRLQRNLPNIDTRGTAQEYADRAWAAGYQLRDGAWDLVHRAQDGAQNLANNLPHQRTVGERIVDGVKSHIPGAHPSATQQVQDGLQSLRDQAAALGDRLQRNLPNIDARGTAQEYADRAWAAGYELRDGAWNLVSRAQSGAQQVSDNVQRNIPNLDTRGTLAEYTARARQAGYELRNGAWNLIHSAQQAGHEAAHNLQQAAAGQHPVHVQAPAQARPIDGQGVPLAEALSEIQNAETGPTSGIHVVDPKAVPRESLGDKLKHSLENLRAHLPGGHPHAAPVAEAQQAASNVAGQAHATLNNAQAHVEAAGQGIRDRAADAAAHVRAGVTGVVGDVKGALPTDATLHHLRKEAEYVEHRTVHKAEEMGHRVEEKLKEAADHIQYHMPN